MRAIDKLNASNEDEKMQAAMAKYGYSWQKPKDKDSLGKWIKGKAK